MMWDDYFGHMWGWGLFQGSFMMIIFWAVIIFLIIWLVREFGGRGSYYGPSNRPQDAALEILRQRYAKGEINKEEFEARKKDLTS